MRYLFTLLTVLTVHSTVASAFSCRKDADCFSSEVCVVGQYASEGECKKPVAIETGFHGASGCTSDSQCGYGEECRSAAYEVRGYCSRK